MTEFNDSKPSQIDVGMRLSYLFAPLLAGCATVVIPPVKPVDPVSVYIADYGKHSSLFLPNDDGTYVEYAMGDWDFLALGRTSWWVAMRAMVRSPQATLGRRTVAVVNPQSIGANSTISVRVSHERATSLLRELDERFRRSPVPPFFSTSSMLDHVPDPEPYWGLNNCNHLTAEWLRKLGCQLHGPAIWSNFILDPHAAR